MAQVRCFTLRLPQDLYVRVFEAAEAQKKTLNATVIDMILIALSKKMDVRSALIDMLDREFPTDAITSAE